MKTTKTIKRIFAAVLVTCLAVGTMCMSAFASETTWTGWSGSFYIKKCTEDAGRSDYWGDAIAGRNTYDRDAATVRYGAANVWMTNGRSYHTTISVKDWRTGGTIREASGPEYVHSGSFYYSSPISVFACT